jgi:hypothetical protein
MHRIFVSVVGSAVLMLGMATGVAAGARQAGAHSTDPTDKYNVGARSTIGAIPLPQYKLEAATSSSVWVGEILSDGSFYQVGAATNLTQCGFSCFTYFVQAFDPRQNLVLAWPGGAQIGSDATHTYAMQNQYLGNGIYDWYATFDGTRYNNTDYYPPTGNSGSNIPYAVTESANNSVMPDPGDTMGDGTYNKALQTRYCGTSCSWYDTYHAAVYYLNPYCQPINVVGWGYNSFSSGTGLTGYNCRSNGTALW